jgi:ABC-type antimicrobial peptide transport system permease subunit
VATLRQVIDESLSIPRMYTWLLGLFAATGTLLAAAGIYSVIAYLVVLRTREFGIRMAMGADAGGVVRLVLSRGAALIGLGLTFGMGAAAALTRLLRSVLYGVDSTDPMTFAAMAAVLAAVGIAACLVPAWRAGLVDPAVALRSE